MRAIYTKNQGFRLVELDADWTPGKKISEQFIAAGLCAADNPSDLLPFLSPAPRALTCNTFAPLDYPSRYSFEIEQEEMPTPRRYRTVKDIS